MGLSVLVSPRVDSLKVTVRWGDYIFEGGEKDPEPADHTPPADEPAEVVAESAGTYKAGDDANGKPLKGYRRKPREEFVTVTLPSPGQKPTVFKVPNSDGLMLTISARSVTTSGPAAARLPSGTKSVSIFLVNKRSPNEDHRYRAFVFQTTLIVTSSESFVPRPNLRGAVDGELADEWDERVADLQFRDVFEYAVGHGVSAAATCGECSPSARGNLHSEPREVTGRPLGPRSLDRG